MMGDDKETRGNEYRPLMTAVD